jgi:AcrR family transcriptional regulator
VPRSPRARRAYHHGDLRRALVAAATAQLDRQGPLGVTLRGAARAAGVSQAAPYRHFASKEALLAAVAESAFRALRRACEVAARATAGAAPAVRLDAVATAYVRFALGHPARYRLMWAPRPRGRDYPDLQASASGAGFALGEALASWGAPGPASGERFVERFFVTWSLLHGLVGLLLDEQLPRDVVRRVPPDALVRTAMRVLREGILPVS